MNPTPAPSIPLKLFKLLGEHVQALASASSLEAAEQLFTQHLEPWELSGSEIYEEDESDLPAWGLATLPDNPAGTPQLLVCRRGDFH